MNAQTGLKAAVYRFGAGVLIVCEEPESGVALLATLEEQAAARAGVTPGPGFPGPLLRAGGQSTMVRFIVGMLWILLLFYIVLVLFNVPGVR